jgi:hypothetical protein
MIEPSSLSKLVATLQQLDTPFSKVDVSSAVELTKACVCNTCKRIILYLRHICTVCTLQYDTSLYLSLTSSTYSL